LTFARSGVVSDSGLPIHDRIERGERPACIDVCRFQVRYFGDLDDPASEASEILAARSSHTELPEKGTEPKAFLLD
jgi:Fe-S-cluster-containing dehydrogenase component